jgi:hypothetical protein
MLQVGREGPPKAVEVDRALAPTGGQLDLTLLTKDASPEPAEDLREIPGALSVGTTGLQLGQEVSLWPSPGRFLEAALDDAPGFLQDGDGSGGVIGLASRMWIARSVTSTSPICSLHSSSMRQPVTRARRIRS